MSARHRRREKRDEPGTPSPLNYSTVHTDTTSTTDASDTLAQELLEEARKAARSIRKGASVTVELTVPHPEVQLDALILSLTIRGHAFNLEPRTVHENTFSFRKV